MPVSFQILNNPALVVVRYSGLATVAEGMQAFQDYLRHPDSRPGQRHLVDLAKVSEIENDFAALFRFQADKASALLTGEHPIMIVYLAPTEISQRMAQQILRSWEGLPGAIIRIAEDWDGAMDILGLRRDALDALVIRTA
jgi:hypothetical protein